jgi:hypothetical protein
MYENIAKHETGNRIIFPPHVDRKHVVIDRAALHRAPKHTPSIIMGNNRFLPCSKKLLSRHSVEESKKGLLFQCKGYKNMSSSF